jgi:hypothetical protein
LVLVEFGKMLDEFGAAVRLGADGRMTHTAATRELEALTKEAGRLGRWTRGTGSGSGTTCRALEQWVSARTVLGDSAGVSGGGAGGGRRDTGGRRRSEARA